MTQPGSLTDSPLEDGWTATANRLWARSDEMGALPTRHAATETCRRSHVGPDGFGEQRGHPRLVGRSNAAADEETGGGCGRCRRG